MKFEFLEHTADVKFRAFGKSLGEAFENAILAFADFVGKNKEIQKTRRKRIEIKGDDKKSLFYNFLEELIYLLDTEGFVVSSGKVRVEGNKLVGELEGDDVANYESLEHVKAATYAEMRISKKDEKRWFVQAVMDV